MYDPGTLAIIATVVTVAGTAYSAVSQSNAADYNAQVAENNAVAAQNKAAFDENIQRQKVRAILSQQRSLYGSAGVDASQGTPLLAMKDTAGKGELDALAIRYGGKIQSMQDQSQADIYQMKGQDAIISGIGSAGSSLLSGYGRYQTATNSSWKGKGF